MADGLELSDTTATPEAVGTRRRLLKSLVAGGGVAASGAWVPESWTRPVIESVLLPAHAQTTADNVCMNTSTGNAEFAFTGEPQDFEVPAGVCSLTVTLNGAGGAGAVFIGPVTGVGGGAGEQVTDTLAVTPLEVLTIIVGGGGQVNSLVTPPGGFGGGSGGDGEAGATSAGGGGGASSVRRGAVILLEAGGGGGGGGDGTPEFVGGDGGGVNGGAGGAGGRLAASGEDAGNGNGAAGSTSGFDLTPGDDGSVEISW